MLYIASGGIEEPLIVSQVLRYLQRLKTTFDTCHLITLERCMPKQSEAIKRELEAGGIHWHGLRSAAGLRMVNLWRDVFNGYRLGKKLIAEHRLNVIHARSFIPGNIGLRLAKKTDARLLYDMRGFWSEEKFAKGTIKSKAVLGIARSMERRLFQKADALVSLTHAGDEQLCGDGVKTPIHVIPCCVDTELFQPKNSSDGASASVENLRLISVGSLGPGYLPEAVMGLFEAALNVDSAASLQLLTRSDAGRIRQVADQSNCDWNRIQMSAAEPDEVVRFLQNADVGLCMIQPSKAKIASSPTKLAEYLACGLPVIANAEMIGDVGAILTKNRVGVVVDRFDQAGFADAIKQLLVLFDDPKLSQRCRETAVEQFSVDVAVARYSQAYRQLLSSQ